MAMVNPFDVFSVSEISASINIMPNNYGRLNELGLFPVRGTVNQNVFIEEMNGSLALIPSNNRGGPGNVGSVGKRKGRTFTVPNLTYDEFAGPEEVSGVRQFGGADQEALGALLNLKLATARAKHDITLEHLRMGALKGTILDADGATVLFDLYNDFGVTQKVIDFELSNPATDVRAKCLELKRHIEDNLAGEVMREVRVLVDGAFFDLLTGHDNVKATYANWQAAAERIGGDMRNAFPYGGIVFEEYRARSTDPETGNTITFIAPEEGHAFPLGTINAFATFAAPADFNETVGTLGQLYYAKTIPAKFDRGWEIHTQSNPLPLCMRPALLVKCVTT